MLPLDSISTINKNDFGLLGVVGRHADPNNRTHNILKFIFVSSRIDETCKKYSNTVWYIKVIYIVHQYIETSVCVLT